MYRTILTHPEYEIDYELPPEICLRNIESKQYVTVTKSKEGYRVWLDGKNQYIHRLIVEANFIVKQKYSVRFKDRDKLNYKLDNLVFDYYKNRGYSKQVMEIDQDNPNNIKYYNSVKECAKVNLCSIFNIYESIRHNRPYDGYYYKYVINN